MGHWLDEHRQVRDADVSRTNTVAGLLYLHEMTLFRLVVNDDTMIISEIYEKDRHTYCLEDIESRVTDT